MTLVPGVWHFFSRAYTSFLPPVQERNPERIERCVNALSGLYLVSTTGESEHAAISDLCQCPLGLIHHFYEKYPSLDELKSISVSMPSRAYTSFLRGGDPENTQGYKPTCQCPLGLIHHFYSKMASELLLVTNVSMPSRAYTSFLHCTGICRCSPNCVVSMPSRAYTSFLRYPFKNLDFMRFPEPVFAGIYQNILTTAVFRAC